MRYRFLAFLLFVALPCLAHYPMSETDLVNGDHVVVWLSPEQTEEVGRTRILTLDKNQVDVMRKLVPSFPDRIKVITPSYHDCKCGMYVYGIWTRRELVALPYPDFDFPGADLRMLPPPRLDEPPLDKGSHILFDIDGAMYFAGEPISEEEILHGLDVIGQGDENGKVLWLNLPPRSSEEVDEAIQGIVERLKEEGAKRGVDVEITG